MFGLSSSWKLICQTNDNQSVKQCFVLLVQCFILLMIAVKSNCFEDTAKLTLAKNSLNSVVQSNYIASEAVSNSRDFESVEGKSIGAKATQSELDTTATKSTLVKTNGSIDCVKQSTTYSSFFNGEQHPKTAGVQVNVSHTIGLPNFEEANSIGTDITASTHSHYLQGSIEDECNDSNPKTTLTKTESPNTMTRHLGNGCKSKSTTDLVTHDSQTGNGQRLSLVKQIETSKQTSSSKFDGDVASSQNQREGSLNSLQSEEFPQVYSDFEAPALPTALRKLSRSKRFLAFPEGSTFTVSLCITVGIIGNPNYSLMSYGLNWGLAYDLPNITWILNHLHGFATHPVPWTVLRRRSRRALYKEIEGFVDNMGYNGRDCVLRALCESRMYFTKTKMTMVGEMVRAVFSLPKQRLFTRELREKSGIEVYDHAYRHARSIDCESEYPCEFSLLELAFGKYSKPPPEYFYQSPQFGKY